MDYHRVRLPALVSNPRRVEPLPPGWDRKRRRVLRKHGGICHVCHQPGATEVDHVIPASRGGSDDEENLRPIHHGCHLTKTGREARGEPRRRSAEPHPGDVQLPRKSGSSA